MSVEKRQFEIGDFVKDVCCNPPLKGRILAFNESRDSPAYIVIFTDGTERSVHAIYLQKLQKRPEGNP